MVLQGPMLIRFIERRPPSIIVLCAVVAVTTFAAGLLPTFLILAGVVLHSACHWLDHQGVEIDRTD